MEEIWKDIKGYEGLYQVSNLGQVRSYDRVDNIGRLWKGGILKCFNGNREYLLVKLRKNGIRKGYLVHRLVAEAFIPNPDNLPEVNHKDCNPCNNIYTNLEFCNRSHNVNWGDGNKKRRESNLNHPNKSKKIKQYTLDGDFVKEWPSIKEIERQLGFFGCSICACCKHKKPYAYNYKWEYADNKKEIA